MKTNTFKLFLLTMGTVVLTCGGLHAAADVQPAGGGFLRFEDWRTEMPSDADLGSHRGSAVYLKADSIQSVKVTSGDRVEVVTNQLDTLSPPTDPWGRHMVYYWEFTTENGAGEFAAEVVRLIDEVTRQP